MIAWSGARVLPDDIRLPSPLALFGRMTAPLRKEKVNGTADAGNEARLSTALTSLGPSYIKLGQFLATRDDIIGRELAADLATLQDRLPPFSQEEAQETAALEGAFERAVHERVDALTLVDNLVLTSNAARVGGLALAHRLPMMSTVQYVTAGGLIGYGPNRPAQEKRAATYVDKILKGANPAELPVERPEKFDLVINLTTAQALGLTIPQSVLAERGCSIPLWEAAVADSKRTNASGR